ncbi:MAG: DUF4349 domain-containing protein [Solirubrobacterales bacterium]
MLKRLTTPREPKLSADQLHEFEVIDRSLSGVSDEGADDAGLMNLALLLRDARPTPEDAGYATRMDDLFLDRDGAERAALPLPRMRRVLKSLLRPAPLAGALAVCVLLVSVATISGSGLFADRAVDDVAREDAISADTPLMSDDQGAAESTRSLPEGTFLKNEARPSPPATITPTPLATTTPAVPALDSPPTPTPPTDDLFAQAERRHVDQTATLKLATANAAVEDVADQVISITDRHEGFVLNSDVSGGDDPGASFTLQIPATRFAGALAELSKLGHVRSRTQSTVDVTASHKSARERLTEARERVNALLERIESSATPLTAKPGLRKQLSRARDSLRARRGELASLRQRENFVPLSVSIAGDGSVVEAEQSTLGRAVEIAVDALEYLLAVLLIAVAIAVPLTVLAAGTCITGRRVNARRRNGVVDRSAVERPSPAGEPPADAS